MSAFIPQVAITELLPWRILQVADAADYNLSAMQPGRQLPDFPYRASFYAIGLCRAGTVELTANLDGYHVGPGSLVLLGPEVLRSWQQQSADYSNEALFFTEAFLADYHANPALLRQFAFFHAQATRVLPLSAAEADRVGQLLGEVRQVLASPSQRKADIVRGYVAILLYLAADSYEQHAAMVPALPPRPVELVARFQQLVGQAYPPRCR